MQFDLGTPQTMRTIYLAQVDTWMTTNDIQVFVGNSPGDDPNYQSADTLCYTGWIAGFKDCGQSVEGQYIIITAPLDETKFSLAELLAWDAPFIQIEQTAVSSVTFSNMSLNLNNIETMIGENRAFNDFLYCP